MMDLKSAVVLVTGGSSGIGLGLARQFLAAGSTVIVCGRRPDALEAAKKQHPQLITHVADTGDEASRVELFEWTTKNYPKLNVIVNNAGIQRRGGLSQDSAPWTERQKEIAINLEGPIHLTQLFTPHLLKQKEAAIVNVTSGLAFVPPVFAPVYGATKAALHSFTQSLRWSLEPTRVRVVEIVPPAVKTNLGGSHDFGEPLDEFCQGVFQRFAKGESEIGYGASEKWRLASRQELEGAMLQLAHAPQYEAPPASE